MPRFTLASGAVCAAIAGSLTTAASAQEKLHFTYLWHLEQPVYWPDQSRQFGAPDRYENAWESVQQKNSGDPYPLNNLNEIFGKPDRVAAYQGRIRDSIDAIDWAPEAGAQVSYSGGLIRNIESLGNAGQLGYGSGWNQPNQQARSWRTLGASKPRLDMVVFPFHHSLMPLIDENTQRKEIQAYKHVYTPTWGTGAPISRGFFPSEMAFSTRLIKVLDEEGIDWSIVSAEKISRATEDFPVVLGSGGVNCDPPNRADMINPAVGASNYYRVQISRGCAPAEAYPFSLTPHRVQYVDPASDPVNPTVHEIIAIPASQSVSWEDGYNPIGTQHFDNLQTNNDPNRPMLVVLAHDGDNAFGGGYSYYLEATPNLVSAAQGAGYHATVVEEYLADHPVPANDIVHVEDGAWVNADGDFGSPWFLNWNYPPVNAQGQVDIENGWAEDIRNWAVITAAQNHVDTAEQISTDAGQPVRIAHVVSPNGSTRPAERAWHYFLGSLNSGYMYYGTANEFEVKPSLACNEALQHTAGVIAGGTDNTAPSIWIPQRWPWNPGEMNFGAPYGYQPTVMGTDFHIWTFVHDVSGLASVTLRYRVDDDGVNPLGDHANELYAQTAGVGAWQSIAMNQRSFPAENVFNNPEINFFEMPADIADQYTAQITGLTDTLVDYYVEAIDANGNVKRSPIQHVWIGDGEGAVGGGGDRVVIEPEQPQAGTDVQICFDAAGGPLAGAGSVFAHVGFNGWSTVLNPDRAMSFDVQDGLWKLAQPVAIPSDATQLNVVFNNGAGTWDNNNGQDWQFNVTGAEPPDFIIDGSLDAGATLVAQNDGLSLYAGLDGNNLYVAGSPAGAGRDHFLLVADVPGGLAGSMWAKGGLVAQPDAFIGNENDNNFHAWFDNAGGASSASGSILEGLIDINAEFGGMPDSVHLAIAAYDNSDGGALLAQAPAGSGANLEAGEYVEVVLCDLDPTLCPSCPADVNGDGFATPADFTAWLAAFNNPLDPNRDRADVNTDGTVSPADFTAWLAAFGAGCG